MHNVTLPKAIVERIVSRRGRLHVFDEIDRSKTALLVVDMQNAFVQQGAINEVPVSRDIVPNINRLAKSVRQAGCPVIWIQTAFVRGGEHTWPFFFEHLVDGDFGDDLLQALSVGDPGYELWSKLDVHPDDLRVQKTRFSAFIQGASDIESILRDRGIDTVLITGTLTNVCCESSARDAMMRDFKAIMVSDANAARNDAEHLAALTNMIQLFGDVRECDEVIAMLGQTPLTPA